MYRTLFGRAQDRKFAIRYTFNIVSAGQRRPLHALPKCTQCHTPGVKGVHTASHYQANNLSAVDLTSSSSGPVSSLVICGQLLVSRDVTSPANHSLEDDERTPTNTARKLLQQTYSHTLNRSLWV